MRRLSLALDMLMHPDKYVVKEKKPPARAEPDPEEPIDPNYQRRDYQLVQVVGDQRFKLQIREAGSDVWVDYRENLSYRASSMFVFTGTRDVMEKKAKDVARNHYRYWKNNQGVGTIIPLGKLP